MGGIPQIFHSKKTCYGLIRTLFSLFLLQHFLINFTSVFSPETFNEVSHFMGTNFFVQFLFNQFLF